MLQKILKYSGTIELLTGMLIGGSNTNLNVGGADTEVIKDPINLLPYIPGSSIKGKIRSLLEHYEGKTSDKGIGLCQCGKPECLICTMFGTGANNNKDTGPTRLIFRDCHMSQESIELVNSKAQEGEIGNWLEIKTENAIPQNGGNTNPRTFERVPAGIQFDFEVLLHLYDNDNEEKMKKELMKGIQLLELSSLGGSGSRGYGKVKIHADWTEYDFV